MRDLLDKLSDEYEEKRTLAANLRKKRISDVYSKFPRIMDIDNEIYMLGMGNIQKILREPQKSEQYNRELKEKLTLLNEEKTKIMIKNNISQDYDKYPYFCVLCSDTGYTPDGKRCSCYEKRIREESYIRSNLGDKLNTQNFDTFSFDFYSKEKEENQMSPYENIKRIYNGAKKFCEQFDDSEYKNLYFYGDQGLGKTFVSSCIAKELIDKGKSVIYMTASRMFLIYEEHKFGRLDAGHMINDIYECDLLIIDDLGTEAVNKMNNAFLFDILNERLVSGKKMIINTNYKINEIDKLYSKRFTSRLFEYFIIYRFLGEDIRYNKLLD